MELKQYVFTYIKKSVANGEEIVQYANIPAESKEEAIKRFNQVCSFAIRIVEIQVD